MRRRPLLLALALAAATPLTAQRPGPGRADEPGLPRFRFGIGLAPGAFSFDESTTAGLDDDDRAVYGRLELDGVSRRRGVGGGFRIEGLRTEDDLTSAVGNPVEAIDRSIYGHVTVRVQEHRFAMSVRFGLLVDKLELEEEFPAATFQDREFLTVGPLFEIEPEVVLLQRGRLSLSVYGEVGFGGGHTWIDVEGDGRDWNSTTAFLGLESGVRLRWGPLEAQAGYVGRFRSMERSDVEGSARIPSHDGSFHGAFFGFGVAF